MTNVPTVSVIIPTYNRATLLSRAIRSVIDQTYHDFELIIVDDASTDKTHDIVNLFDDHRIRYVALDQNRGGSAARNIGIKLSRSKYIAFLDSDDQWLPDKLIKQVQLFDNLPEDNALVFTWLAHIYEDGRIQPSRPSSKGHVHEALLLSNIIGSTSSVMIRKDVLSSVGGFDESLPARQDMDLWVRIAERFSVDFVPEVLVNVFHSQTWSRISSDTNKLLEARELFYRKHKNQMMKAKIAHLYLCDMGQFCREYTNDASVIRRFFVRAIRKNSKAFLPYFLFFSTFFPRKPYFSLRSWIRARRSPIE